MPRHLAYEGPCFAIEWYFDTGGKSQALEYFQELNEGRQDKTLYLLKRMGDFGKISNKAQFRYEGDDIFAFKPQPDRFLCFFVKGRKIIITNAFVKKSDALPRKEKQRAMKSREDFLSRIKEGIYYEQG
ncbi:MAG: type II toxin-antitoxin system RelE/ParE family toxin [Spirochaetes bacterium]|nr:type II toxin-antitoxin system RelE/ParE family toxin [Spirochaetota bacterium]